MKNKIRLIALFTTLLAIGACDNKELNDAYYEHHNVVYYIDGEEHHEMLYSEVEWDRLLDKLLDYSKEGSTVVFYNAAFHQSKASAKGDVAYRTRDRKMMKEWCKKMEREGRTVTITYDKQSGEWSGKANK